MQVETLSISDIAKGFREKTFSSEELTKAYLERISKHEKDVHAFISLDENTALSMAKEADMRLSQGDAPLLAGIPCAVKDCFCTKDMQSTGGSKILEGYKPPYDATAVKKLKEQSMVILGKANTDEFTMGTTSEFSAYGPSKNPFDTTRVAGGSSGGSAAAVSAGFAPYALGTDTGGSIRLPAAFCGVTGMKNTYGRVSRYGVMSMASSLDTIGAITKNVEDAGIVLSAIAGQDPYDATTSPVAVDDYVSEMKKPVKGMKIGLPKEYFTDGIDPAVQKAIEEAIAVYKDMGVTFKEVSLPHTDYALAVYYIIAPAEISSNMSRYDAIRYGVGDKEANNLWDYYRESRTKGLGPEVKRRIMMGTYVLSSGYYDAYYKRAQKVRTLIIEDFKKVFNEVDALLAPSAPMFPFKLGEKMDDPISMYLADIFTVSTNVAGICGLSVPCGMHENLPIGLQILTDQWKEARALQLGYAFQKETQHHKTVASL